MEVGGGGGAKKKRLPANPTGKRFLLPPPPTPSPFIYLFCSRFSFRTVTQAEKLVTRRQATNLRTLIPVYN